MVLQIYERLFIKTSQHLSWTHLAYREYVFCFNRFSQVFKCENSH